MGNSVAFGRGRLFKAFYDLGYDALVGPEVEEKFQGACAAGHPCWLRWEVARDGWGRWP